MLDLNDARHSAETFTAIRFRGERGIHARQRDELRRRRMDDSAKNAF